MKRSDRITKHDAATIEAVGVGIGIMFALALASFITAVMAYVTLFIP